MQAKAIVLDRDGTLIEHVPYLHDPKLVRLLPGVREGLSMALSSGLKLFLHSNQSGVGRGYFPLSDVDLCNRRMLELIGFGDNLFTRVCIAPEAPDRPSAYRKPSPRFAEELMRDFNFHKDEIWYVGDRGSDLAAAHAAGTRGVGVATGLDDLTAELLEQGLSEFPVFRDFETAVSHILKPI